MRGFDIAIVLNQKVVCVIWILVEKKTKNQCLKEGRKAGIL